VLAGRYWIEIMTCESSSDIVNNRARYRRLISEGRVLRAPKAGSRTVSSGTVASGMQE